MLFRGVGYHKPLLQTINLIIERNRKRALFYEYLMKFVYIVCDKKIKMIFENPYDDSQHYLKNNFIKNPAVYDKNRMLRGDYFKKPTAYWYFNCEPTYSESYQNDKEQKFIRSLPASKKAGFCSEERSLISSDYARNFICDFILGEKQENLIQQIKLF